VELFNRNEERHLIQECQKGDQLAFERLYQKYSRDVYTMALRMTGSEEIAEEVTQEVFISIYKNIKRFQFQSAFTTWIYRIVMRRAADYFRKNRKHQGKLISLYDNNNQDQPMEIRDPTQNPAEEAVQREKANRIEQAILGLQDKQRDILILRYVNQLSYEEIAQILRCRIGTVKSRLNRAHKLLEQILRQNHIDSM
jgi:RNA polymerase sigma-70 factor (ECF subfamily)